MAESEFVTEKGFQRVVDKDGNFIWNAMEYNGHLYSPFGDSFVDRLDSYKETFPVYDNDIYLLAYPKSGRVYKFLAVGRILHTYYSVTITNINCR